MAKKTREEVLQNTIQRFKEKGLILPTYEQMRNPELVPQKIKEELKNIGLWDFNPLNLFRLTWKNNPETGEFGKVNYIELPSELTGVKARIFVLAGKFFPTGAHKVGATFGPLVEKLVNGTFDPTTQKALWPSTGNYCRGGAYDSKLLGCESIAVLPEDMSQERFEWLKETGAEIFATHGSESNVKEIYDKVKVLMAERGDEIVNLNQFAEIGNPLWHYAVTGPAMEEVFGYHKNEKSRFAGIFLTQGSAGTLGSGEYLKTIFPNMKLGVGEAVQCPTLLRNGFGAHRIEGIGDKHIPWIHNIKSMDFVAGIDDEPNMHIMRLFNEPAGHKYLLEKGVKQEIIDQLHLLGISGIANVMGAIKQAKYYEMDENDFMFTIGTDSMEMYQSRLVQEQKRLGDFTPEVAAITYYADLMGIKTDNIVEPNYLELQRMHNLKYFTWVEQQGKDVEELNAQWYDHEYWTREWSKAQEWDEKIREFNAKTGVEKKFL
jgi:cysteine synthase